MTWAVVNGDLREVLARLPDVCVDAVVCDPPYELGFMGKRWDSSGIAFASETWAHVLRVLKPGGHMLAFSGTRTYHRMVCAIEDAGFEIRDQLGYFYGTGFPKSLNVAKQLEDRAEQAAKRDVRFVLDAYVSTPVHACRQCGQVLLAGLPEQSAPTTRAAPMGGEVRGEQPRLEGRCHVSSWEGQLPRCEVCTMSHGVLADGAQGRLHHGAPARNGDRDRAVLAAYRSCAPQGSQPEKQRAGEPDAVFFQRGAQEIRGTGTALKPAQEPIVLARKPFAKGDTVAANVLAHGTGGINVDACRIGTSKDVPASPKTTGASTHTVSMPGNTGTAGRDASVGRWPANVLMDEDAAALLDAQSGITKDGVIRPYTESQEDPTSFGFCGRKKPAFDYGGSGGASRFFYVAKASKAEREAGLGHLPLRTGGELTDRTDGSQGLESPRAGAGRGGGRRNHHPTVKPIALMRYLVRLITPPGGVVLDPFCGSGSTIAAAVLEGFNAVGIDLDPEYVEIARARVAHHEKERP
jgi:hypothetical protein